MYSNFTKFILTLTGLSPIILSYWIVDTTQKYKELSIYLQIDSIDNFCEGVLNVFYHHYLLLIFMSIVFLCNFLLKTAINSLTIGSIEIKSIKPVDVNFNPFLFSYFLPMFKFFMNDNNNHILLGLIIICFIYSLIGKNSYHFNLIFRLFFRYRNYEIQTKKEVTYLMLSKKKIVNSNQVNKYVQLSDYMILDVSK